MTRFKTICDVYRTSDVHTARSEQLDAISKLQLFPQDIGLCHKIVQAGWLLRSNLEFDSMRCWYRLFEYILAKQSKHRTAVLYCWEYECPCMYFCLNNESLHVIKLISTGMDIVKWLIRISDASFLDMWEGFARNEALICNARRWHWPADMSLPRT